MYIILNEGRPSGKKSFPLFGILYLIYYIYITPLLPTCIKASTRKTLPLLPPYQNHLSTCNTHRTQSMLYANTLLIFCIFVQK